MDFDDTQGTTPNKHNPIVQLQARIESLENDVDQLTKSVETLIQAQEARERETSTAYLLGYIHSLEKRIRSLEIGPESPTIKRVNQ